MVNDEADGTFKVLALIELSTNCVGCVVVGQDAEEFDLQVAGSFGLTLLDFFNRPAHRC